MSTRCTIHFCDKIRKEGKDKATTRAIIYRHCDGYPESMIPDLKKFIDDVNDECGGDTRFNDPEYLAARFVAWNALLYTNTRSRSIINFIGIGVCSKDPGDIDYRYRVICSGDTPTIVYEEVNSYSTPEYEVDVEKEENV